MDTYRLAFGERDGLDLRNALATVTNRLRLSVERIIGGNI